MPVQNTAQMLFYCSVLIDLKKTIIIKCIYLVQSNLRITHNSINHSGYVYLSRLNITSRITRVDNTHYFNQFIKINLCTTVS